MEEQEAIPVMHYDTEAGQEAWPDPTESMLQDPTFLAIWGAIKTWGISVPSAYTGYSGATGNHVRCILDAIQEKMETRQVSLEGDNNARSWEQDKQTLFNFLKYTLKINITPEQALVLSRLEGGQSIAVFDVSNSLVGRFKNVPDRLFPEKQRPELTSGNIAYDIKRFMELELPEILDANVTQNVADELNVYLQKRGWPLYEIDPVVKEVVKMFQESQERKREEHNLRTNLHRGASKSNTLTGKSPTREMYDEAPGSPNVDANLQGGNEKLGAVEIGGNRFLGVDVAVEGADKSVYMVVDSDGKALGLGGTSIEAMANLPIPIPPVVQERNTYPKKCKTPGCVEPVEVGKRYCHKCWDRLYSGRPLDGAGEVETQANSKDANGAD